jgi:hypothetical protein
VDAVEVDPAVYAAHRLTPAERRQFQVLFMNTHLFLPLTSLGCQASELVNSDTRPRPTTQEQGYLLLADAMPPALFEHCRRTLIRPPPPPGLGRVVVSEIEAPNLLANLV